MTVETFTTHNSGREVGTLRIEEITAENISRIHKVPAGAAIKLINVVPGTATVYSTQTPKKISDLDETAGDISGNANADWDEWAAGPVTVKTVQAATLPLMTVVCVPVDGEWILEITTGN